MDGGHATGTVRPRRSGDRTQDGDESPSFHGARLSRVRLRYSQRPDPTRALFARRSQASMRAHGGSAPLSQRGARPPSCGKPAAAVSSQPIGAQCCLLKAPRALHSPGIALPRQASLSASPPLEQQSVEVAVGCSAAQVHRRVMTDGCGCLHLWCGRGPIRLLRLGPTPPESSRSWLAGGVRAPTDHRGGRVRLVLD